MENIFSIAVLENISGGKTEVNTKAERPDILTRRLMFQLILVNNLVFYALPVSVVLVITVHNDV